MIAALVRAPVSPLRPAALRLTAVAILATVAAAPTPAAAQVLQGRVLDAGDGTGVRGAEIYVSHLDGSPAAAAIADSEGVFLVRLDDPGRYLLRTSRYGYATRVDTVATTEDGDAWAAAPETGAGGRVVVRLTPEAIAADGIVVRAERGREWGVTQFERRRAEGRGYFLDEDYVRAVDPTWVHDVLYNLPDLKVFLSRRGTRLVATNNVRRCVVQLINGMPGRVDMIDPDDIMGVEVYTNYRDVPAELAELRHRASRCALVNYWTRAAWSPDTPPGPGLNFSPVWIWGLTFGMLLLMVF